MSLEIKRITKTYEGTLLLRDISLTFERGEIVCLLGPSGSGKTTLLRIIAGLEFADSGDVFFDGANLREVPVHQRGFGMMFQDLALFPHKNVFDNIAFGLRMKNMGRDEIRTRVEETLDLVGLAGFATRNVNNLSGGEQQRIALARSLAPRPRLLMLDEPLGALDRILREQLVADLRAILKRIGMTAVYVTHDQDEAFALADRIAVVHEGNISQFGTPEEIYRAPANAFVAQFLGLTNLFDGVAHNGKIETKLGIFEDANCAEGQVVGLVRAEQIKINNTGEGIDARVEECIFRAGKFRVRLVTDSGAHLVCESERAFAMDAQIKVKIESVQVLS
jgi:ABC-type Fe3+/spermidine/putrescine transport system ATPase subunit